MKITIEFGSFAEMKVFAKQLAASGQVVADEPRPENTGPKEQTAPEKVSPASTTGAQGTGSTLPAQDTHGSKSGVLAAAGSAEWKGMKTLRQVVAAFSASAASADAVVMACFELKKQGGCPPLSVISEDQLEDRVRATCDALGIPANT